MQAVTTRDLMCRSCSFKTLFVSTIVCFILGGVFNIVWATVDCYDYVDCSSRYSYYTAQCYDGYNYYCCHYPYSYCGSYNDCISKPYDWRGCYGYLVASWALYGIAIVCGVFVLIMFRNFKQRVREAGYAQMSYQQQAAAPHFAPQLAHPPPVVVYSNQAQAPPNPPPPAEVSEANRHVQ